MKASGRIKLNKQYLVRLVNTNFNKEDAIVTLTYLDWGKGAEDKAQRGESLSEISKEKLEWMKETGIEKFDKPMLYYLGTNQVFSEDYIKNTPLEKLQERHNTQFIND